MSTISPHVYSSARLDNQSNACGAKNCCYKSVNFITCHSIVKDNYIWVRPKIQHRHIPAGHPTNASNAIRTHHDWPSQIHENVLITRVKTRVVANVWTPLINKFECICEGHATGVYYIMIIIKISKKTYFRPNFPFPSLLNKTLAERYGTIWSCLVWLLP